MVGYKTILQDFDELPVVARVVEKSSKIALFEGQLAGISACWFIINQLIVDRMQLVLRGKFGIELDATKPALLVWFKAKPPIECLKCSKPQEDSRRFLKIISQLDLEARNG